MHWKIEINELIKISISYFECFQKNWVKWNWSTICLYFAIGSLWRTEFLIRYQAHDITEIECLRSFCWTLKGHDFFTASYLTERNPTIAKSMSSNFASQCGFCTPGMATKIYQHQSNRKSLKIGKCSNPSIAIQDNLCRCTGYRPILQACKDCEVIDIEDLGLFSNWYWLIHAPNSIRVYQRGGVSTILITSEGKGVPVQPCDNKNDESNLLQDLSKYTGHGFKYDFFPNIYWW